MSTTKGPQEDRTPQADRSRQTYSQPHRGQDRMEPAGGAKQQEWAPTPSVQPGRGAKAEQAIRAWVVKAAKQPMVLETVSLGPLGAEEVEVAVEHCGLCHSDLSVWSNEWGISQYPATLGHEVTGRVTAVGPNAKGINPGDRVGVGWYSGCDMYCRQCMSGNHHLCPQAQAT